MTQPEDDKPDVGADRPEIATRSLQARESSVGIQVVVMSGNAKGTSRRIGERLRIGKAVDNDLVLHGYGQVSSAHAVTLRTAGLISPSSVADHSLRNESTCRIPVNLSISRQPFQLSRSPRSRREAM